MHVRDLGDGRVQITGAVGRQARFANGIYKIVSHHDESVTEANTEIPAVTTAAEGPVEISEVSTAAETSVEPPTAETVTATTGIDAPHGV